MAEKSCSLYIAMGSQVLCWICLSQIYAIAADSDFLNQNQKKRVFFFHIKKIQIDSGKLGLTMNGCVLSSLSKYIKLTFISMNVEEKIFQSLALYLDGQVQKGERATCIPQHGVGKQTPVE